MVHPQALVGTNFANREREKERERERERERENNLSSLAVLWVPVWHLLLFQLNKNEKKTPRSHRETNPCPEGDWPLNLTTVIQFQLVCL